MVDQESGKVIANRDEPIPIIVFPDATPALSRSSPRSDSPKPSDKKNGSAHEKLKRLHEQASAKVKEKMDSFKQSKSDPPKGIQDRMMEV
jgi:hypothetical protein